MEYGAIRALAEVDYTVASGEIVGLIGDNLYSDPGTFTGGSVKTFLMQHLHEVAIDHSNGIFAGTNNYLAEIGGRQPMTVEEFVSRNRETFV
jgi:hypothetical protein